MHDTCATAPVTLATAEPSLEVEVEWPALPTETEIYILPNGEVVVADLPAELAELVAELTLKRSRLESDNNE
ncbi:MAG: hypothetical protein KDE19_19510 [Caldilineaceae bacterium]|nr:hypothetical protein [Caldilineaceae bacterium]